MSEKPVHLFARTIRGLEWVAAAELERRFNVQIIDIQHREVRFHLNSLDRRLLNAGSVDDIFITCKIIRGLDHTRAALFIMAKSATSIDFPKAITLLRHIRKISKRPNFDIIASFLGRRNYNRYEIEDLIGEAIEKQTGWRYTPQRSDSALPIELSFRIHLSGDEALIGMRLTKNPLHRRTYKIASRTGTLHPPLAFAMAMLSNLCKGHYVLDPFCGVGTIPIEALRVESEICSFGVDVDNESLLKAVSNAEAAKTPVKFLVGDAGQLPFADGVIDRIISNPPWGQVVGAQGKLVGGMFPFFIESKRLLSHTGRLMMLTNSVADHLRLIEASGLKLLLQIPVSLFGSWPEICLLTDSSRREKGLFNLNSTFGPQLTKYWQRWPVIQKKIYMNQELKTNKNIANVSFPQQ